MNEKPAAKAIDNVSLFLLDEKFFIQCLYDGYQQITIQQELKNSYISLQS